MAGRKPYVPTDEQRRTVHAMAGFGVPYDDFALVVRCRPFGKDSPTQLIEGVAE